MYESVITKNLNSINPYIIMEKPDKETEINITQLESVIKEDIEWGLYGNK